MLEIRQGWLVRREQDRRGAYTLPRRSFPGVSEKSRAAGLDPLVR